MSTPYVILIIVLVLGFIAGNIMMLRHMGSFNITPELRKKIEQNNRKADLREEQDEQ
ncbi:MULTISPECIES: DUF2897 family protein [unclassified Agarivorans]|uniref:DUF2897 family protein n=1 Tax=unclassified Agarivorans TaxID=2636026 RepID=UPI0010EDB729|nr:MULTISPECIES: DUF2897 family protein [unclassified Agarivorans]MDO6687980.1 DUF2897 family protein [Agarivorans sp. 3_MG-2023]MDO6717603.1 DUF2897 family protein [Agarivorans sp. 2_MG-2023]MDO6766013.1 DUF2897 family protein [Agarivorans sp. 1_MG-2023]GDY27837.1 hypothetical protein AHAT_37270 [Agarivorans sp. Toyoura001]